MFLSKILIHSCMTIYYIMEENIFIVIINKPGLKLIVNKRLRCLQKKNMLDLKLLKEK